MKMFKLCFVFVCAGLLLSACSNTLEGAGEDIEGWGEAIQDTFD